MRLPDLIAATRIVTLAAGALCASAAFAQFKWIGPNGTVTYGDIPPPGVARQISGPAAQKGAGEAAPGELPYALKQAASKHPVTLYTTSDCQPCQQARNHLIKRGIPFAERSVTTSSDADAFKRIGFADNSFPALRVGRERAVGFEAGGWDQILDAAGYPKTSALPPGYRHPPARGLGRTATRPVAGGGDAGGVMAAAGDAEGDAEGMELAAQDAATSARRSRTPVAAPPPPPSAIRF